MSHVSSPLDSGAWLIRDLRNDAEEHTQYELAQKFLLFGTEAPL